MSTAWYPLDASGFTIPGFEEVKDSLGAALDITITTIETIQAMYEVVKLFTFAVLDPLQEALEFIRAEAQSVTELLTETGAYALFHAPVTLGAQVNPAQMMSIIANSMLDEGDPNRPDFDFPQEQLGFVVLFTGPNFDELMRQFSSFMEIMLRPFKVRTRYKTKEELQAEFADNPNRGKGKAPDWESTQLGELFPVMVLAKNAMIEVLALIQFALDTVTLIETFIAYLDQKIAALNRLTALLQDVQEAIDALSLIPPGDVLFFEGIYTTPQLAGELLNAGLPDLQDDVEDLACASFTLLLGGAVSPLTVTMLKSLFGVP